MIYLSNEPYPQEISVPRSFGVIVPHRNEYLSTADIAADLTTDSDTKVLAASQGVVLKEMVDAKADASDVYTKQEVDADLALKADKSNTYTKAQVDGALAEKADVSDIPTKTSDLTNDSGFVTGQQVSQVYETKSDATAKETALQNAINRKQDILTFDNVPTNGSSNPVKSDGIYDALATKQPNISDLQTIRSGAAAGATAVQPAELQTELLQKQDRLISGQNIKTINNTSLLGSGNIVIQGGSGTIDNEVTKDSPNAVKSSGIYDALGKYGVVSQTQTWTGGASTGYTYTMSNQVWGLIPQANIDLYESAGAVFNETTGYFELNGLTDISYEEMKAIYTNSIGLVRAVSSRSMSMINYAERTALPLASTSSFAVNLGYMLYGAAMIETLTIEKTRVTSANMAGTCQGAHRLKVINGNIILNSTGALTNTFKNCYSLESVALEALGGAVSFAESSLLTAASVAYMINKSNTSAAAFTITLHATAYARVIADADVQAALAAHTNVTLASN